MARLSVALLSTVLLSAAGTAHAQQQQALVLVQAVSTVKIAKPTVVPTIDVEANRWFQVAELRKRMGAA